MGLDTPILSIVGIGGPLSKSTTAAQPRRQEMLFVPLKRLSRQGQQGTASGGERSFDDLVGAGEDRWRDRQPECRCGLEVDDKVEFYRLLDGQVAGFRSFQDPVYIIRRPPEVVGHIGAVRDQAATIGV